MRKVDDRTTLGTPVAPKRPSEADVTVPGKVRHPVPTKDLRGQILDGIYRLKERINQGGMGEIWRAEHVRLGTQWLCKVLPPVFSQQQAYIDALLREAKLTANLPGGYFPIVVHSGTHDEIAYYVMEDIPGADLSDALANEHRGGMSASTAVDLLLQILEAMEVAHKEGVVHRDLKPDNIFIEKRAGRPGRVRILDFGVAKANMEGFATLGTELPKGTQQYMAPELHKPIPDPATASADVFAIGLVAYQMILGRHPFSHVDHLALYRDGAELGLLHEHETGKRAGVNGDIAEVFFKATRFDPAERYQNAGEMLQALRFATEFRAENISEGTVLDNAYRVLGKVGAGGMGAVYYVEDIHKQVAEQQVLKILSLPAGASESIRSICKERFRRECETLHGLQHPAIPYIYGNGSHEGIPYLVMGKAEGGTFGHSFARLLSAGGWGAVFEMAAQVADALDTVHKHGIIHRDIKPSNIIINPQTAKATVLDFGIARIQDTKLTSKNTMIGTPGFSPCEQLINQPVPATDQWAFAACFYGLLSGVRPGEKPGDDAKFSHEMLRNSIIERIIDDEVIPFSELPTHVEVPPDMVKAIEKAMSHEPSERFPSVTAFVQAMAGAVPDLQEPQPIREEDTEQALRRWVGAGASKQETPFLLTKTPDKKTPGAISAPPSLDTLPSSYSGAKASLPQTLPDLPEAERYYTPTQVVEPEKMPWATPAQKIGMAAGGLVCLAAVGVWIHRWTSSPASPAPKQSAAIATQAQSAAEPPALESQPTANDTTHSFTVRAMVDEQPIGGWSIRLPGEPPESSWQLPAFLEEVSNPLSITLIDGPFAGEYVCDVPDGDKFCTLEFVSEPSQRPTTSAPKDTSKPTKARSRKTRKRKGDPKQGSMFLKFGDKKKEN